MTFGWSYTPCSGYLHISRLMYPRLWFFLFLLVKQVSNDWGCIVRPLNNKEGVNVVRWVLRLQLVVGWSAGWKAGPARPATLTGVGHTSSRYRLQSRTTDRGRRCHRILPQPSRHGLHEQKCVPQLAGLSLFLVRMTMARIFLLAVILLAPTSKTSPRLQDYSHHNFNSVLNEVPSKGTREEGVSLKPTQLLLKPTLGCGPKLYFLVIVHSAPNHFRSSRVKIISWHQIYKRVRLKWSWAYDPDLLPFCDCSWIPGNARWSGILGGQWRLLQGGRSPPQNWFPTSTFNLSPPLSITTTTDSYKQLKEMYGISMGLWVYLS